MRPPRRPNRAQADLFTPPPQRPHWATLPPEIRTRALALLTRLLRTAHDSRAVAAATKGVGRE
jgi:hypothetical protein